MSWSAFLDTGPGVHTSEPLPPGGHMSVTAPTPIEEPANRHLVQRAMVALHPDPVRRPAVQRTLDSLAEQVTPFDFTALVESLERASHDINHQLLLERYGSVSRG